MSVLVALVVGASPLLAADYSVGTVRPTTPETFDPGNGLNLYSITAKGVDLVKGSPYILQQTDYTGRLVSVFLVLMNPAHDFVYVVYSGSPQPNVVGFAITPKGLVYQWQKVFTTGNSTLDNATVTALDNFIIEDAHPAPFAHLVTILSQSGQVIMSEFSENLVSGHAKRNGNFYYSCRSSITSSFGGVPPADSVAVYDLGNGVVTGSSTVPLVTSTDPAFVRSVCN
jgi:hypothetical protein